MSSEIGVADFTKFIWRSKWEWNGTSSFAPLVMKGYETNMMAIIIIKKKFRNASIVVWCIILRPNDETIDFSYFGWSNLGTILV